MKIAVLGATGMAGSAVVTEALHREHTVLALSRRPDGSPSHDRLSTRALDAAHSAEVADALTGVAALVLTIRLAPGQEHRLAPLTRGVLDSAARTATRVLVIGGAGPLRSPIQPHRLLVSEPTYVPDAYRALANASVQQLRTCQDHAHQDWVYLSPPAVLEPGGTKWLLPPRYPHAPGRRFRPLAHHCGRPGHSRPRRTRSPRRGAPLHGGSPGTRSRVSALGV